ncbi:glycosyltransferase [Synechococcus sp. MIT S9503]|uniref:glycosyltransferase n=1 Tax=Synechococcus sp. MIT S9503 TaxID=3082547 RepID=UPI0039A43C64
MTKFLILEDSSKSGFGGGQRVTLNIINVIQSSRLDSCNQIYIFDFYNPFHLETEFSKSACQIPNVHYRRLFVNLFQIKPSSVRSSNSVYLFEAISYPLFFVVNSVVLLISYSLLWARTRDRDKLAVYISAKSPLFLSIILTIFRPRIYYHSHNVAKKGLMNNLLLLIMRITGAQEISVSKASSITNTSIVIPNPSSSSKVTLLHDTINLKFQDKCFATMSNLLKWKGIQNYLDAIPLIDKFHDSVAPRLSHRIYGKGNYLEVLQRHSIELSLHSVSFRGFVSDVLSVLRDEVFCLVLPSIACEACPMTLIEAVSLGVPVITTNIGGQYEYLPDCLKSYCYPPGDKKALAMSISKLASLDESSYLTLCENILNQAFIFSYKSFSEKVSATLCIDEI